MVLTIRRLFILSLMACTSAMLPLSADARGQGTQTDSIAHPQVFNHTGIYALQQAEPALTGYGVKFAVVSRSVTYINDEPQNDYRPSIGHNCFKGREFILHDDQEPPPEISPHSTAICSILLGQDPDASATSLGPFYYQGAATQAQVDIYELWYFVSNNVFPLLSPDADVLTASFGNQSQVWWTRGIEVLAEKYGLIVVAAIGNGTDINDPPLYPGAGANAIGVGVVDSVNTDDIKTRLSQFALAYPEHSSLGPTEDGRCKPDIVAPGNCLAADIREPNRYEPTGNWSSFSTPIVAGAVGLLVQKAKQEPALSLALSPEGGNCVIKAIILNSAVKLPFWHKGRLKTEDDHLVPLDYIQGAGMLNAVGAYELLTAGPGKPGDVPTTGWDLNELKAAQIPQSIYRIALAEPTDKILTASVVWNRHYGSNYPFEPAPEKDSDLRLELWAVDPNDTANDRLVDYSDSKVDNVEHIYAALDPNYTHYEIVVSYNSEQIGKAERYGLAWNVSDKPDKRNTLWYDLNADGVVNEADILILLESWLNSIKSPQDYFYGDINSDGAIDANDLDILTNHLNTKADWYTKN